MTMNLNAGTRTFAWSTQPPAGPFLEHHEPSATLVS